MNVALGEGVQQGARRLRRRRHRTGQGQDHIDPAGVADAARHQIVVQHQGAFVRRRRAFVRRAAHADQRPAAGELRQDMPQSLGAGDGIELRRSGQAGRGVEVVFGAQCDHQYIGFEHAVIGGDAPRLGIYGGDSPLQEPHPRLGVMAVRHAHRLRRLVTEHDIQLGKAEDEMVALVDQRHIDTVSKGLGQPGCQFQAAEAGAQHQDAGLCCGRSHGSVLHDEIKAGVRNVPVRSGPAAGRCGYRAWAPSNLADKAGGPRHWTPIQR